MSGTSSLEDDVEFLVELPGAETDDDGDELDEEDSCCKLFVRILEMREKLRERKMTRWSTNSISEASDRCI